MDNQYPEKRVAELEKSISDLQRDKDKLVETINVMSDSIEGIKQTIIHLEGLVRK
ncbi:MULTISPECIES: hypothetical protein [Bacillus]|uniref:hypothetical protein n=1 Tax=Bacillus TaxID=1386 RepID=UPI0015D5A0C4|nr:hypothetical protein [Bacillus sp. BI3]